MCAKKRGGDFKTEPRSNKTRTWDEEEREGQSEDMHVYSADDR